MLGELLHSNVQCTPCLQYIDLWEKKEEQVLHRDFVDLKHKSVICD